MRNRGQLEGHGAQVGAIDVIDRGQAVLVFGNIVPHLRGAQRRLQLRQTALFYKADAEYGERVAAGLELSVEVKWLAPMSQEERVKATSS